MAFAWVMAFVLPVSADTFSANQRVATDQMLDVSSLVSTTEYPSGADSVLLAEEHKDPSALVPSYSENEALDLLADTSGNLSETGEGGVRRFIFLAILFGAALRYLTSPTFYKWAAEVFDPLGGY